MGKILTISVKEDVRELRLLQKKASGKYKALQMLLLIKQKGALSKDKLSVLTGASNKSIHVWRSLYLKGGLSLLLRDNRGGRKPAAITAQAKEQLSRRLHDPKEGFRSFIEIQQWLLQEFDIQMNYHAVRMYVKRKFDAKLKVSRKSHVLKRPADEAVFKKRW
jgi:transposase